MHTSIDGVLPILHWFSGSIKVAARAWTLGCYFSINPRMLEHDAGLKLVKAIPVERLLLETDAPFSGDRLALPTGVNAEVAVMNLARVLDMTPESLQSVLTANASRVLAFAGVELRVSDRGSVEGARCTSKT